MDIKNGVIYARSARNCNGQIQTQLESIYAKIEEYAADQKIKINVTEHFIDNGANHEVEYGAAFKRMISLASGKNNSYDLIFMQEPSRILRSIDLDDLLIFEYSNIEIVYCEKVN